MKKLFSFALLGLSLLCTKAQMQLDPIVSYMTDNIGTFNYDGFDGPVSNVYRLSDGKFLCVGSFKTFDGIASGGVVRLLSNGQRDASFNVGTGFNGPVHAAVMLNDGSYIFGGDFTHYGTTQVRKSFCKINANGSINTAFNPNLNGLNGVVYDAKLLRDGNVVLVGKFNFNQTVTAPCIIFINPTNGANVNATIQGTNMALSQVIYSVDQDINGKIILGGKFSRNFGGGTAPNKIANNFIRLNEDFTLDSTYLVSGINTYYNPINSTTKAVRKVKALADGTYIVAGNFNEWKATSAAATSVSGYVKINNTTGEIAPGFQLPSGAVSTASKEVLAFGLDNTNKFLFAYHDSTSNESGLIRTETDGSSAIVYPMYQNKEKIQSITTTSDSRIAIAGDFKMFDQSKYTNNIAKFTDVLAFSTIDSAFNHHKSINLGSVYAMARASDIKMYIGGDFKGFGSTYTGNLVRLNLDGTVDPTFNVKMQHIVYDIIDYGTKIYVAHSNGITCFNTDGTINATFQGSANGAVRSIKILNPYSSPKLMLGGEFTNYSDATGATGASKFMVVDLHTGARNATYMANKITPDGPVYSIDVYENHYDQMFNNIFIGGKFLNVTQGGSSKPRYNLAVLSVSNFLFNTSTIGDGGGYFHNNNSPSWINKVKVITNFASPYLFIGGNFSKYQPRTNFAGLNNINNIAKAELRGNAHGNTQFENALAIGDEVYAIEEATNGNLMIGLKSTNGYKGDTRHKYFVLTDINGNVNTMFSSTYTNVADAPVRAMYKEEADSWGMIGGDFSNLLDANKKRFAKIDMTVVNPYNLSTVIRCQNMDNRLVMLLNMYPETQWYSTNNTSSSINPSTTLTDNQTYYVRYQDGEAYSPLTPVLVSIVPEIKTQKVVAACSSYTWINGQTYTASTTAPYPTYKYHNGTTTTCDSIYELVLTINQPSTATVNHTACESYTWPLNGITYTSTTSVTHTIPNGNHKGCDSTITLNLVIKTNTTASVNHTACYTYTWPVNGQTYTTSGTRTATIPNAAGCDSTITLNLVIGQRDVRTETEVACGSFTWAANNQVYTSTQKDTLFLQNVLGCDSLVVLDLIINQPSTATAPVSIAECNSYTWQGTTYTTSGSYTKTLANAAGCDSVVTIDLTINNGPSRTETFEACDSYTWSYNNITYNTAGTHSASVEVPNGAGCDSVITLNLTIVATPSNAVTLANGVLTATASGATYQWYDCATNTAIAGATTQTYNPTALGKEYKVEVTNNDCSVMSNCVFVPNIGVKENEISVNVFPNPTQNFTQVVLNNIDLETTLSVIDVTGKVLSIHKNVMNTTTIDLSNYADGVYFIKIQSEELINTVRIVKY